MEKRIKIFNNLFIILIKFTLIILLFYVFSRINLHSFKYNLIIFSILSILILFYLLVFLFAKNEWKTSIVISTVTLILSLFLIEYILNKSLKFNSDLAHQRSLEAAKSIEPRSRIEILNDLTLKGLDPTLTTYPVLQLENKINTDLFPLSGISNKLSIFCNEEGYYSIYNSDKYGFNNPNNSYNNEIEIILIGDSFVQGACVREGYDVTSQLRNMGFSSLSMGMAGNGPLIELATLTEYAKIFKPKFILWMYHKGDIWDLSKERHNKILKKYLDNDYSQNLIDKQIEIDKFLINFLKEKTNNEESKSKNNKSLNKNYFSFFKFKRIRTLFGLYDKNYSWNTQFNSNKDTLYIEFENIINIAKNRTHEWGGEFYFVYLPSWYEYTNIFNNYSNNKNSIMESQDIISIIKKLNIKIIDFNDFLKKQEDPHIYFPFKLPAHYNKKGYQKLAEHISKEIIKK